MKIMTDQLGLPRAVKRRNAAAVTTQYGSGAAHSGSYDFSRNVSHRTRKYIIRYRIPFYYKILHKCHYCFQWAKYFDQIFYLISNTITLKVVTIEGKSDRIMDLQKYLGQ